MKPVKQGDERNKIMTKEEACEVVHAGLSKIARQAKSRMIASH